MPSRHNPFEPNRPVNPYMFAGRSEEISKLHSAMHATRDGNPNHLLFIGERGIGKSSILLLAKYISDGSIILHDTEFNYMPLYISLDSSIKVADLCGKIERSIAREYRKRGDARQRLKDIWDFVKRIEISGSGIKAQNSMSDNEIVDRLVESISRTIENLSGLNNEEVKYDGIVFLIDEIDNISDELQLGMLIKKITEQLTFDQNNKALFILSGLPCSRDTIAASHPSSLRIFEEKMLAPLLDDDCAQILRRGLEKASKDYGSKISITDAAISKIAFRSEGYPHFIQQFAYCAYNNDTDNCINQDDVNAATLEALRLIGTRYYDDLYYKKIKKDSYRQVLRIMSKKLNDWVSKKEIREKFKGRETTLNNAITALKKRNIILGKRGSRGKYRLQWIGFALWIRFIAKD